MRAAGAVLPGRAQPGEAPRECGHCHLPREHGGCVRGHRVQAGYGGRGAAYRFSEQRPTQGRQEESARRLRRGHQADFDLRHQATGTVRHSLESGRKTVTLVHKGNIQKFTEGAFREWGYEVAVEEFRDQTVTERESWILGNADANPGISIEENAALIEPGLEFGNQAFRDSIYAEIKGVIDSIGQTHGNGAWKNKVLINDRIADSIFQQIIIRPADYSVLATTNLNGDYISDAAAAQVGGLGIAPGANIGDGFAVFEATHGTAPKYADKDVINPGSVILSGVMLLDFIGWKEAAKLIETAMEKTILQKFVTYDFERQTAGATKVGTSEFATRIIGNM